MSRRRAAPRFDDKRPPLARLESFISETAGDRKRRIMGRVYNELDASVEPGPWISAARSLEARGIISADGVIYFTDKFLECVTQHAFSNDPEMVRLNSEMRRIELAHGLREDETWSLDEAPAEWLELNAAWDRRDDQIKIATLRALGHGDLADLLKNDPGKFETSGAVGYRELWGEIADAEDQVMAHEPTAPESGDNRPPLARLEAVVADPARARTERTFNRIRFESNQSDKPRPWLAAARSLASRGVISADTEIYLAEIFLEGLSERASESDAELVRLSDEMDRCERAHGLDEDEYWRIGEAPPEYRTLSDAWNQRDAAIRAAILRSVGLNEVADLLEKDLDEFDRRSAAGHAQLWGDGIT